MRGLAWAVACAVVCWLVLVPPVRAQQVATSLAAAADRGAPQAIVPLPETGSGDQQAVGPTEIPSLADLLGALDPRKWAADVLRPS